MSKENENLIGDEINALLEGLESDEVEDDEVIVDEEEEEEEATPPDEGELAKELETGPEPDPEPTPPPEEEEVDDKDKLIDNLRKTIDNISGGRLQVDDGGHVTVKESQAAPEPEPEPEPAVPTTDREFKLEVSNFIKEDETLDDILDDPSKLNEVLNRVAEYAVQSAIKPAQERILRSLPHVIQEYSKRRNTINSLVGQFYEDNKDLTPYKRAVAAAANTVHAENPGWDHEKVFEEAAKKTRETLGLKAKVSTGVKTNTSTGLKKKSGGSRNKPTLSGIAKEIADMENL